MATAKKWIFLFLSIIPKYGIVIWQKWIFKQSDFKCFGRGIVKMSGWVFWFSTLFCSLFWKWCTTKWFFVKLWCHIQTYYGFVWSSAFSRSRQKSGQSSSWFWHLLSKRQNHEEDRPDFCGLLGKAELYLIMIVPEKEHYW